MTTQLDFDTPPLYDGILNTHNLYFSDIWIGYWSSFIQTLVSYLTQNGIMIPNLTLAERNGLIGTPTEGQLIYVIDAVVGPPRDAELQVWQVKAGVGAWRTITTTP